MDKDAEIPLLVSGFSFFFFYGLDNQHRQIGPVEHRLRHRAHQRALQRARAAADQVGRGRDDRLRAQQGTMVAAAGASAALIVTDDVVTTGSTMSEAVRALRAAGYLVRGAAVVCDTPRWATPR